MNIKKATLIALCGNAAVLLIYLLGCFNLFPLDIFGRWNQLVATLASTGTLVFFLYTLYRKQP